MKEKILLLLNPSATRMPTTQKPAINNCPKLNIQTKLFWTSNFGDMIEGGMRVKGNFKEDSREIPLVSVITVVYNGSSYLEKTILSVLEQTYFNIEYILIDGGSTDGTVDILKKYNDFLDYWISEPDGGIYNAMNKGLVLATGKYLNFLNCGDSFYDQNVIQNILEGESLREPDIIYGNSFIVSREGKKLKELKALKLCPGNLIKYGTRTVCHQAILVRKQKAGYYNLKYKLKAELEWYLNMLEATENLRLSYKDFPIVYYRLGGVGSQRFYSNFWERVRLINNKYGLLQSVKNVPFYLMAIFFHYFVRLKK